MIQPGFHSKASSHRVVILMVLVLAWRIRASSREGSGESAASTSTARTDPTSDSDSTTASNTPTAGYSITATSSAAVDDTASEATQSSLPASASESKSTTVSHGTTVNDSVTQATSTGIRTGTHVVTGVAASLAALAVMAVVIVVFWKIKKRIHGNSAANVYDNVHSGSTGDNSHKRDGQITKRPKHQSSLNNKGTSGHLSRQFNTRDGTLTKNSEYEIDQESSGNIYEEPSFQCSGDDILERGTPVSEHLELQSAVDNEDTSGYLISRDITNAMDKILSQHSDYQARRCALDSQSEHQYELDQLDSVGQKHSAVRIYANVETEI